MILILQFFFYLLVTLTIIIDKQDYAIRLLRNMYDQINFTESANEDVTTKLRRELILSTSCLVRYADCLNVSKNLFQNWIAEPGKMYRHFYMREFLGLSINLAFDIVITISPCITL